LDRIYIYQGKKTNQTTHHCVRRPVTPKLVLLFLIQSFKEIIARNRALDRVVLFGRCEKLT